MSASPKRIGKFLSDCWIEYLINVLQKTEAGKRRLAMAEVNIPGAGILQPETGSILDDSLSPPIPEADRLTHEDWQTIENSNFTTLENWMFQYRLTKLLLAISDDLTMRLRYREKRDEVLIAFGLSDAHKNLFADPKALADTMVSKDTLRVAESNRTVRAVVNEEILNFEILPTPSTSGMIEKTIEIRDAIDELQANDFLQWEDLKMIHVHSYS